METFTICPVMLYAVAILLGISVLSAGVWISAATLSHFKRRRALRREKEDQHEAEKAAKDRIELTELFPHPWLDIWDDCKRVVPDWRDLLLKAWLERSKLLPEISFKAVQKLATMVAESHGDYGKLRVANSLRPYLAFKPSRTQKPSQTEPEPWKITCIFCGSDMHENSGVVQDKRYYSCPFVGCRGYIGPNRDE